MAKIFRKTCVIYHQGDLKLPRLTGNFIVNKFLEIMFDVFTIPAFFLTDIASTYTRDYAESSRAMKYSLYKFRPYIPTYILSTKHPSIHIKQKLATLKKKHTLVGFAGRFVEEKGYDVLFQAIPTILQKNPQAHFIFAGKTNIDYEPFYEYVAPYLKKHKTDITFFGLLSEGDYRLFFESLDAFVISSRSDCFPTTQIEAVIQGIPVVCTDIPGARMLVKETGIGEIVPAEDPLALAESIVKVTLHSQKYRQHHEDVITFLKKYEKFPTHL